MTTPTQPNQTVQPMSVDEAKRRLLDHGESTQREWNAQIERAVTGLRSEFRSSRWWAVAGAVGLGMASMGRARRERPEQDTPPSGRKRRAGGKMVSWAFRQLLPLIVSAATARKR